VPKFAVILPAAGSSSRFRDRNYKKPFAPLAGRAVWLHSAHRFIQRRDVLQVIVAVSPDDREYFCEKFASEIAILGIHVVEGGKERGDSVRNALATVKPEADFVCIHDAARPCLADPWIDAVFAEAEKTGAAILAVPAVATLKQVANDQTIVKTIPRNGIWEAQTPQVFRRDWLLAACEQGGSSPVTDDAQWIETAGHPVRVVPGSSLNIKITTREDLSLAEKILEILPKPKLAEPRHPFADDDLWR